MRGWWKAVRAAAVAVGICSAGAFGADAGLCARGEEAFADKLLSAMRFQFGGHVEKKNA